MKTEFDQLEASLVFGTPEVENYESVTVDPTCLQQLQNAYEEFCRAIPEYIDPAKEYKGEGDPYTQCAHDYVMTRMGHGVGFWETSDWKYYAGERLTRICREQGTLESYIEDGVVYLFGL